MKQSNTQITRMAEAMMDAVQHCCKSGHNPGRVGRLVVTNNARGSYFYAQRSKKTVRHQPKGEALINRLAA